MKKITVQVFALLTVFTGISTVCAAQSCCEKTSTKTSATACSHCGKTTCDKNCSSKALKNTVMTESSELKALLPSCNLSANALAERKNLLQSTIVQKITKVEEMETGYDLVFNEPKEYAEELLAFINYERSCCASFSYALIFEPNNKATHLKIYGSKEIKKELSKGFKELGLLK